MSRIYFGTDGIRGIGGPEPDHAGLHAAPRPRCRRVLKAASSAPGADRRDTRISGYMIESALEAASLPPASTC